MQNDSNAELFNAIVELEKRVAALEPKPEEPEQKEAE